MENPIVKPIGTDVLELDTPAVVLDLDVLDFNIKSMADFFEDGKTPKLRPYASIHRCPAIAHKQISAGGTVGGICVSTLDQAEVFADSGITDILLVNFVITKRKIDRLLALAKRIQISVVVETTANLNLLADVFSTENISIDVFLLINSGGDLGCLPGETSINLAQAINAASGVKFKGIVGFYEGFNSYFPIHDIESHKNNIEKIVETKKAIEQKGLEVEEFCLGATFDYEWVSSINGVTQILAGGYALMDSNLERLETNFIPAARVLGTVTGTPEDGIVITDAGQKSIGADAGTGVVSDWQGLKLESLSAEHGTVLVEDSCTKYPEIKDKMWFVPWDMGGCLNSHDYINGAREGKLEVVWEITARGNYR